MRISYDITEQFYGISAKEIGDIVIFSCFDRLTDYERCFRENRCSKFRGYYPGINIDMGNSRLTIIYSGSGDSRLGDAVLALKYTNCKRAIYCGAAGGLISEMHIGSFFIAENAISKEGFTSLYSDRFIISADPHLVNLFKDFLQNRKMECVKFGRIITLDSVFFEDDDFFLFAQQYDCNAVDLETAAFYTACKLLSISGMAFHFISDKPREKQDFNFFTTEGLRSYFMQSKIISEFIKDRWNTLTKM